MCVERAFFFKAEEGDAHRPHKYTPVFFLLWGSLLFLEKKNGACLL